MRRLLLTLLATLAVTGARATPVEGVTIINSRDHHPALMTLIESAESHIGLALHQAEFYEDYPGSDSNLLCDALAAAAERGVDVTIVIDVSEDDWNGRNAPNTDFAQRIADAGGRFYTDDPDTVTHTKLMVFDGQAAVICSTNWSHYSLTNNNEVGAILWGEEIAAEAWDLIVAHAQAGELQTPDTGPVPESVPVAEGEDSHPEARGMEVLPARDVTLLFNEAYTGHLRGLLGAAQARVEAVQVNAYFYRMRPPHAGDRPEGQGAPSATNLILDWLAEAAARGVQVAVTLDGGTAYDDEPNPLNRNLDFGLRAINRGIGIWWDSPEAQTHAKMVVVDDTAIVGSHNWTVFAVEGINNELSVAIDSPEVAEAYAEWARSLQAGGEPFTGDLTPGG